MKKQGSAYQNAYKWWGFEKNKLKGRKRSNKEVCGQKHSRNERILTELPAATGDMKHGRIRRKDSLNVTPMPQESPDIQQHQPIF
jgi:hypothetical protein